MVVDGDLEASERSTFFGAAELVNKRSEENEKVLQNNSDALNVKFVGELGDQKPNTGDHRCETKDKAGKEPDLDTVARADSTFISSSTVEHLVADRVHHDQTDCSQDAADVVTEVRSLVFISCSCDSDHEPPSAEELKMKTKTK